MFVVFVLGQVRKVLALFKPKCNFKGKTILELKYYYVETNKIEEHVVQESRAHFFLF